MRVPRPVVFALGKLSEYPARRDRQAEPDRRVSPESALARLHYESDRAATVLGWRPRVGVREGIKRVAR